MGKLLLKLWEKIMAKIYIVDLSAEEKEQLHDLTSRGQAPARKLKRAQILLLADEGKKDETIAEMLHVGRATVERIRKRFVLEGLTTAINERPRPGGQRKLVEIRSQNHESAGDVGEGH